MKNGDTPIATLVATDQLARTMRKDGVEQTVEALGGLTKREYFAAMAMQSMIIMNEGGYVDSTADQAVKHADALLKALEED